MDGLIEAAVSVLAAVALALAPTARRMLLAGMDLAEQRARLAVQQRLGEAAARVAGAIAAEIVAEQPNAPVPVARIEHGAIELASNFAETVAKHGIPPHTLTAMIAGELGKLGVGVAR